MASNLKEALAKAGLASKEEKRDSADAPGWTFQRDPTEEGPALHEGRIGRLVLCPITAEEVKPALAAWLDPAVLIADKRSVNTADPPVRRQGLFVCVAIDGAASTWAGLTTTHKPELVRAVSGECGRFLIEPEWRSGGFKRWKDIPHYLTDGASLWHGPTEVFVAASWRERSASGGRNRARITGIGLAAIRDEIEANRRRRSRLRSLRLSRLTKVERV
jgi:hypothetical protein